MQRIINALWIPALVLASLFSVAISISPGTSAQTSCLGNNLYARPGIVERPFHLRMKALFAGISECRA